MDTTLIFTDALSANSVELISEKSGLAEAISMGYIKSCMKKGLLLLGKEGGLLRTADEEDLKDTKLAILPSGYFYSEDFLPLYISFKVVHSENGLAVLEDEVGTAQELLKDRVPSEQLLLFDPSIDLGAYSFEGFGLDGVIEHRKKSENDYKVLDEIPKSELTDSSEQSKREEDNKEKSYSKLHESKEVKSVFSQDVYKPRFNRQLIEVVFNELNNKGTWGSNPVNKVDNYISAILRRVHFDKRSDSKTGSYSGTYILSKDKNLMLFNTALLSRFETPIYLIDTDASSNKILGKKLVTVRSREDLITMGFIKESLKDMPEPCKFYKERSELQSSLKVSNLDLNNFSRMHHILECRRHRFPENMQELSLATLSAQFCAAIYRSLKMAELDIYWMRPTFNFENYKVSWLLPLHFGENVYDTPDLAVIMEKKTGFWEPATVLDIDNACENTRLYGEPPTSWIR